MKMSATLNSLFLQLLMFKQVAAILNYVEFLRKKLKSEPEEDF